MEVIELPALELQREDVSHYEVIDYKVTHKLAQRPDSYCKKRPDITQIQCWVHTRRYFDKAKDDETGVVNHALELIGKLYRIEKRIRDSNHTGEQKKTHPTGGVPATG